MDMFDRMDRYFRQRMNDFFGPSWNDDFGYYDRSQQPRITGGGNASGTSSGSGAGSSSAMTTVDDPYSSSAGRLTRWPFFNRRSDLTSPYVHVNLTEDENSYHVSAEIPGIPKEAVKVYTEGNLLTIQGEKKSESKKDSDNVLLYERSFGSFSRTLTLPNNADLNTPKVSYENGVLHLAFPKKEPTNRKTINF